jgi:hypothetical protein
MTTQKILAKYHLVEASRFGRYMEMFKFALKPIEGPKTDGGAVQYNLDLRLKIKELIKTFKREDRIVWAFRKYKAYLKSFRDKDDFAVKDYKYLSQRRVNFQAIIREAEENDIAPILNYRFDPNATAEKVYEDIHTLYTYWQVSGDPKKRVLEEGNDTFLRFKDGWEWQVIPEGSCNKEADAMHHCGNVPAVKAGDRLLSLREPIKKKGKSGWKPHATFVLDRDHFLGEMKGYANEKPNAGLHKYIIPLLEMKDIYGIKGGGSAADKNFSLNDLDPAHKKALLEKRPVLMTPLEQFNAFGVTRQVREELDYWGAMFLSGEDAKMYIVLERLRDLRHFAKEFDDDLDRALADLDKEKNKTTHAKLQHEIETYMETYEFSGHFEVSLHFDKPNDVMNSPMQVIFPIAEALQLIEENQLTRSDLMEHVNTDRESRHPFSFKEEPAAA